MTPDRLLISSGPEGEEFPRPLNLDYQHPHAITFCVLDGGAKTVVLVNHYRPHMYIYNGLKKCDPDAGRAEWTQMLETYQTKVVGGTLTRATLKEFHRLSQENNGFPRYAVTSGRLWLNLNLSGQPLFSVMAFWNPGLDRPDGPAAQVVRALKVKGPIYLVSSEKAVGVWQSLPNK
jgi:hypothetical protein